MKTRLIRPVLAVFALTVLTSVGVNSVVAQGTAFTYHGGLTDNGSTAHGTYDLTFALFAAGNGGTPLNGRLTNAAVLISNGVFTATLDFGAGVFSGAPRWLEIGVRANGSAGAYTILSPRQALTPSPYAIFSENIATNTIATANLQDSAITSAKMAAGQVVRSLNGLRDNVTLSAGANVTLTTNGNNLQLSSTAGGGGSSNYVAKTGDTMSGNLNLSNPADLNFGNSTRQMMNLYANLYGIGVQNYTLYERSGGGFAWYHGGIHSDTSNDPGTNGTSLMTLDSYGDLLATGAITANQGLSGTSSGGSFGSGVSGYDSSGYNNATGVYGTSTTGDGVYGTGGNKGVYGITSSAGPTHAGVFGENSAVGGTAVVGSALAINSAGVAGVADTAGSTGVYARGNTWAGFFQGNVNVTGSESFGNATRQMLNLWSTAYGIGVQNNAGYFRSGNEFFWYKGGTHSDTFADPGAGGTQLMWLGNSGTLSVGGVVTPTIQLSGAPGLDFGSTTRQMINLYNLPDGTSYSLGVQNNREYFRAGGTNGSGFAWFAGGSHVDAQDNPGPGGVQLMKLEYGPADGCAGSGGGKFCGPGAILYVWGSIWSLDSSYAYSFESLSDRDRKTGFEPLDAQEVLSRVMALPVTSWAFTNHTQIRHIGPMAQDFHAAFEVGTDDKHISTTDETGVALAAIQGLNQKLESELKTKETEIGELGRRLAQLEKLLSQSHSH